MTLPDCDHGVIVFLRPSLKLDPRLVLFNHEEVAEERERKRARRHLSTETKDSDIVDKDPEDRDGDDTDKGVFEDVDGGQR